MSGLREKFFDYFNKNHHTRVPSAPLTTQGDASLLFVNSGMAPLKHFFTGEAVPPANRLVSCQRCLRAGGKHNDLEQVGYTDRHHTFFEMLGNFSFGDYFKEEAIRLAWTFVTRELGLPAHRLYITVYHNDYEAADLWHRIAGLPSERIIPITTSDNFWSMGDLGPCGPCSEIFFDQGDKIPGGLPGTIDQDGDRYLEIWNLVFMQYNRTSEGLNSLAFPCIDTGMGLERLEAVMEGVTSTYATKRFQGLLNAISNEVGITPSSPSVRIIGDHVRGAAFLVAEGLHPGPDGRGYILRRLLRRAYRQAHAVGAAEGLLGRLLPQVIQGADPEGAVALSNVQTAIIDVFDTEEKMFSTTLHQGLHRLEETVVEMHSLESGTKLYPGDKAFELYDTYGFPVDMTLDILKEKGLALDQEGFDEAMMRQKERSRAAQSRGGGWKVPLSLPSTIFTGYDAEEEIAQVVWVGNDPKKNVTVALCHKTPFYGESGGQMGDTGLMKTPVGLWPIQDTQKEGLWVFHYGPYQASAQPQVGQNVTLTVDALRRQGLRQHHTATHLVHAALREILGSHVHQKGSLVRPNILRFDYSHGHPLTSDQRVAIEALINSWIWQNSLVTTETLDRSVALEQGAIGLFEGKYSDQVRVVSAGNISLELCGGTHVTALGQLGCFKLLKDSSLASGVRRVEAVVAHEAITFYESNGALLQTCCKILGVDEKNLVDKLTNLATLYRHQKKPQVTRKSLDLEYLKCAQGLTCIVGDISSLKLDTVRGHLDGLKQTYTPCCMALYHREGERWSVFLACHGIDIDIRLWARQLVSGRGGGRSDLAQWGGKGALDTSILFQEFKNLCQMLSIA